MAATRGEVKKPTIAAEEEFLVLFISVENTESRKQNYSASKNCITSRTPLVTEFFIISFGTSGVELVEAKQQTG